MLEDGTGFVGIGSRFWFSLTCYNYRSHGWSHVVSDVWMIRWVLKKFSKDTFDGLPDCVKDIKQKLQYMYVCVPHVRKNTTHGNRNLLGK